MLIPSLALQASIQSVLSEIDRTRTDARPAAHQVNISIKTIFHQNSGFPWRSVRARNKCPSVVVTYNVLKSSSPNAQFVGR